MTDESRGQRNKQCDIIGCENRGRILAKFGTIEIAYCPKHRKKYGERIINALVNSVFNYKLTNFLTVVKTDIFLNDNFLCEACGSKIKDYVLTKTNELEQVIEYAEVNEIQNMDIEKLK